MKPRSPYSVPLNDGHFIKGFSFGGKWWMMSEQFLDHRPQIPAQNNAELEPELQVELMSMEKSVRGP